MACGLNLKKFIKEFFNDRILSKFQSNVDEKFREYDRVIKELEERICKLEGP